MGEILPCPFCGGPAEVNKAIFHKRYVVCKDRVCGTCGPGESDSAQEAIAEWNKRTMVVAAEEVVAAVAEPNCTHSAFDNCDCYATPSDGGRDGA